MTLTSMKDLTPLELEDYDTLEAPHKVIKIHRHDFKKSTSYNFSTLLTACLYRSSGEFVDFPDDLLESYEVDAKKWCIEYKERYGAYPSIPVARSNMEHTASMVVSMFVDESPIEQIYADAVRVHSKDRMRSTVKEFLKKVEEDEAVSINLLSSTLTNLKGLSGVNTTSSIRDDYSGLYTVVKKSGRVNFPFESMQKSTGGALKSEYVVFAARPGVGKTAVLCKIAHSLMMDGKKVHFISLEMSQVQIKHRIHAMMGKFNPLVFRLTEDELELELYRKAVDRAFSEVPESGNITFSSKPSLTMEEIAQEVKKEEPDILIVDAMYLVPSQNGQISSDWKDIKAVSNGLKKIAIDHNIIVFASTQLKRGGSDGSLTTEDIAYSDSIAQDADLIFGGYPVGNSKTVNSWDIIKARHSSSLSSTTLKMDWKKSELVEVETKGFDDETL